MLGNGLGAAEFAARSAANFGGSQPVAEHIYDCPKYDAPCPTKLEQYRKTRNSPKQIFNFWPHAALQIRRATPSKLREYRQTTILSQRNYSDSEPKGPIARQYETNPFPKTSRPCSHKEIPSPEKRRKKICLGACGRVFCASSGPRIRQITPWEKLFFVRKL